MCVKITCEITYKNVTVVRETHSMLGNSGNTQHTGKHTACAAAQHRHGIDKKGPTEVALTHGVGQND